MNTHGRRRPGRYRPVTRLLRWLGLDGNPLRRAPDHHDSVARLVLLLLGVLVVAPLAAAVGIVVGSAEARVAHEQANRQLTNAVLLEDALIAPTPAGGAAVMQPKMVPARWQSPSGAVRTGSVMATDDDRAGTLIPIWVDPAGNLQAPPRTLSDAALFGILGGVAALAAGLLVLTVIYVPVHRRLDRARLDYWDDEWSLVGPRWARGPK